MCREDGSLFTARRSHMSYQETVALQEKTYPYVNTDAQFETTSFLPRQFRSDGHYSQ